MYCQVAAALMVAPCLISGDTAGTSQQHPAEGWRGDGYLGHQPGCRRAAIHPTPPLHQNLVPPRKRFQASCTLFFCLSRMSPLCCRAIDAKNKTKITSVYEIRGQGPIEGQAVSRAQQLLTQESLEPAVSSPKGPFSK